METVATRTIPLHLTCRTLRLRVRVRVGARARVRVKDRVVVSVRVRVWGDGWRPSLPHHSPAHHLQDSHPCLRVRDPQRYLAIEPPRAPQRRVECVGSVGRAHDNDRLPAAVGPVAA